MGAAPEGDAAALSPERYGQDQPRREAPGVGPVGDAAPFGGDGPALQQLQAEPCRKNDPGSGNS